MVAMNPWRSIDFAYIIAFIKTQVRSAFQQFPLASCVFKPLYRNDILVQFTMYPFFFFFFFELRHGLSGWHFSFFFFFWLRSYKRLYNNHCYASRIYRIQSRNLKEEIIGKLNFYEGYYFRLIKKRREKHLSI